MAIGPERFKLFYAEDAEQFDKDEEYFPAFEDRYYLVDTYQNVIVFSDGSYDSPEDNNLGRHYRGLVDLLNEVDAERLAT